MNRRARLLLVEDDLDVRLLVERVFIGAGYDVDTTESAEGGMSLIGCRDYDAVVTDGRFPDGTGMEIADRARAKGIPALIVTGYAFDLAADRPKVNLQDYRILEKPVRPHELVQAIEGLIR